MSVHIHAVIESAEPKLEIRDSESGRLMFTWHQGQGDGIEPQASKKLKELVKGLLLISSVDSRGV